MNLFSCSPFNKPHKIIHRIRTRGFTLIELLVVISIIGVLASMGFVSGSQSLERGRDAKRKSDMDALKKAMSVYFSDHSKYPHQGGGSLNSNSTQPNWIPGLVPNYIKKLPADPLQVSAAGHNKNQPQVAGAASPPNTGSSYNMKVLVLTYFPTTNNLTIDSTKTGIFDTLAHMRTWVSTIKTETMQAVQDGSIFHGYSNPAATPALNYSILSEKEYLEALPVGLSIGVGVNRPDYVQILNRENICDLVDNQGLKEVWLFGYHYGNIVPVESNMSGPHGDISNSEGTDDLPHCSKTYILYNYNYGRSSNEATHDHGHQIEVMLKHFGDPMFENNFIGPFNTYGSNDGSGANFHRCGWTHVPPNTSTDYDYGNSRYSWTDCENWTPDGTGAKVNINCNRWLCNERRFHIWKWQNMPGKNNNVVGASNWWDFIGDWDKAWDTDEKLFYDATPPTVPTGLVASNVFSTQLNLSWNASSDFFGVAGYTIARNGQVVGSTSTTTFTDYTVSPSTAYQYTVSAVDNSQNSSAFSTPLSVTTNNTAAPGATHPILDSYTSNYGNTLNSYSWQHSVGNGSNRFLIVGVGIRGGSSVQVSSVTYKGVALSPIGSRDNGSLRTELWTLKNPDTGLNTITVTLNGSPGGSGAGASSWADVDQTIPTRTVASDAGFSNNPSLTVGSSSTDQVVDTLVMPYVYSDPASTAGPGQTSYWNFMTTGDTRVMGSGKSGSGTTTIMSWNTKNEAYSIIGVALRFSAALPSPVPSPSPTPIIVATPSPDPSPPPVLGCPVQDGVYCYVVSATGDSFTLWGKLENINDKQIWNVPGATCSKTPSDYTHYNYCVQSQ